tara:strand:+ start:161 stop:352 length:192 start_codon:yes stop_codon:yes gene_type:complete
MNQVLEKKEKKEININDWVSRDEEMRKLRQQYAAKENAWKKQKKRIKFLQDKLKRYQKLINKI